MFKYGYKAGWLNIGDFFCYRWNPCFYMPLLVGGGTQPYCRTNLKCQRERRMTNYPPPATHSHSAPPSPQLKWTRSCRCVACLVAWMSVHYMPGRDGLGARGGPGLRETAPCVCRATGDQEACAR